MPEGNLIHPRASPHPDGNGPGPIWAIRFEGLLALRTLNTQPRMNKGAFPLRAPVLLKSRRAFGGSFLEIVDPDTKAVPTAAMQPEKIAVRLQSVGSYAERKKP